MTERKLDYVILGLLSHEDMTGYEIKHRIDTALKYFWKASYGSIYPTLNSLVERGFAVKREDNETARTKQIYSVTLKGREYLREWLNVPVVNDELRYETLLKLFFGNESGRDTVLGHISDLRERTRSSLDELLTAEKVLMGILDDDPAHKYYLLTVRFGIRSYRAYLDFCDEAEKMLTEE